MGHKVTPEAMRAPLLGFEKNIWCSPKNSKRFIQEDYEIRKLSDRILPRDAFSEIIIKRTSITEITIVTHKAGVILGKQGAEIEKFTNEIVKLLCKIRKDYDIEKTESQTRSSIIVNVVEDNFPELSPKLIAVQIIKRLEANEDWKATIRRLMADALMKNARGIKIILSGRLHGASIARVEKFFSGTLSQQSLNNIIISYTGYAETNYGICGVKVFVCKNN